MKTTWTVTITLSSGHTMSQSYSDQLEAIRAMMRATMSGLYATIK